MASLPKEIIFEVDEAPEGGFTAHAIGYSIVTEGDNWAELQEMVRDAVRCAFEEDVAHILVRCSGFS
jgi:hypothetical protein